MDASTYKELICPVGGNYCWPFDREWTNKLDSGNRHHTPGIPIDPNIWGMWLFNAKKIVTTGTRTAWNGTTELPTKTVYRANPEITTVYYEYDEEESWEIYRIVGVWDKALPPAITTYNYPSYYPYDISHYYLSPWNYPLFCYEDTDPYWDPADYANDARFPTLYYSGGQFKISIGRLYQYDISTPLPATINSITESSMSITLVNYDSLPPPVDEPGYNAQNTFHFTVNLVETFF